MHENKSICFSSWVCVTLVNIIHSKSTHFPENFSSFPAIPLYICIFTLPLLILRWGLLLNWKLTVWQGGPASALWGSAHLYALCPVFGFARTYSHPQSADALISGPLPFTTIPLSWRVIFLVLYLLVLDLCSAYKNKVKKYYFIKIMRLFTNRKKYWFWLWFWHQPAVPAWSSL